METPRQDDVGACQTRGNVTKWLHIRQGRASAWKMSARDKSFLYI